MRTNIDGIDVINKIDDAQLRELAIFLAKKRWRPVRIDYRCDNALEEITFIEFSMRHPNHEGVLTRSATHIKIDCVVDGRPCKRQVEFLSIGQDGFNVGQPFVLRTPEGALALARIIQAPFDLI